MGLRSRIGTLTSGGGSVAADAAVSVAARIVAMVLSSTSAVLIGATLSKHDYGAYALAAGIAGIAAVALDLGMSSSLARYLAQGRATPGLVVRIGAIRAALLIVGAGVVMLAHAIDLGGNEALTALLPVTALFVFMQGLVSMLYGILPSMRRIRLLLVVTVVQPVVEFSMVLVARAQGANGEAMLLAAASGAAIGTAIGYAALLRSKGGMRPRADADGGIARVADVLHYSRRLFVALLVMMVCGQLDQFVIAAFHGNAAVAPYALAFKLQALLMAPAITATSIVAPRIAGAGKLAETMYRQWLAFFVVLYLGATFVFAVLAPNLFAAINPDYRSDAGVLVALLPFMFLSSIAPLPSVTLNQVGHAGSRVVVALVTLAINAVLDLTLVPPLGAYGAAIGTTVAFLYYVGAHHLMLERVVRAEADPAAPRYTMLPILLRGLVAAIVAAGVALAIRPAIDRVTSGRTHDVLVVLIAVGVPAVLHLIVTTRLIRRMHVDPELVAAQ